MKRRPSIALRLSLGLTVGMALLWIGAAAISVGVMQHELNEAYDDSLQQSAQRLLPLAIRDLRERHGILRLIVGEDGDDDDDDDDDDGDRAGDLRAAPHDASFTYLVRDRAGEIVLRDEHAGDLPVPVDLDEGFADIDGRRAYSLTEERTGFSILVAETSDRRLNGLRDSVTALGMPLLALLPLMVGGVWLAMRLALRPLEVLRQDISQRDSRNLQPLGSDGHPTELAPIAEAVGALLSRLKSALDAERSFAARSAHELRTPIAGALAQTQQLASELGDGPGAGRLAEIEAALKRLSTLSEKLLQMARIEAGFAKSDLATDLLPVLKMVVGDINASTTWRDRVSLDAETPNLIAPMDPDAFAIAARNLVENALKHGAQDGMVHILLEDGTVRVRNAGGVVAEAELARLGQPFVRGATTADGSGLGLSIARSILEQAGGALMFKSPASGATDGFEAVMMLPKARH